LIVVSSMIIMFTRYLLEKILPHFAIVKISDMSKLLSAAIDAIWYAFSAYTGWLLFRDEPWAYNPPVMWQGFPEAKDYSMSIPFKLWYVGSMSFFVALFFVYLSEGKRSDFVVMLMHHFATIFLLATSYIGHYWRIGVYIKVLMDLADICLHFGKTLKYLGRNLVADITFGFFFALWIFTRLIWFPYVIYSCAMGIFVAVLDVPIGDYPLSKDTMFRFMSLSVVMLTALQIMIIYPWTYQIFVVLRRLAMENLCRCKKWQ